MTTKLKLYLALLAGCLLIALIPMQANVGDQLTSMLKLTLTVYALARGLNAVISVAQGTEMSIEPMGVGVTLTPGEILDPLNDLIEQVSTVLLLASASLGVQNILLSLGDHVAIRIGLAFLIVVTIVVCALRGITVSAKHSLIKIVVILTLLRLVVPVVAVVSHQMQDWLTVERQQALHTLQSTRDDVDTLNARSTEPDRSWFDGLKNRLDIQAKLNDVKQQAEQGVEAAIYLLAEFVLIMVLVPLLFIYLMLKLPARIRL